VFDHLQNDLLELAHHGVGPKVGVAIEVGVEALLARQVKENVDELPVRFRTVAQTKKAATMGRLLSGSSRRVYTGA